MSLVKLKAASVHSSRDTLNRIVRAAEREFAAHGLEGARMESIAQQAGISKQLIYHYYRSKEQLYVAVLEDLGEVALAALQVHDYDGMEPRAALRAFAGTIFDLHCHHPYLPKMQLDESSHHSVHISSKNKTRVQVTQLLEILDKIMRRGARSGVFRDGVDTKLFFIAATNVIMACFCDSNLFSICLDIDIQDRSRVAFWRDYAADLLLACLRRDAPVQHQGAI